jgi:hypothetical protein
VVPAADGYAPLYPSYSKANNSWASPLLHVV